MKKTHAHTLRKEEEEQESPRSNHVNGSDYLTRFLHMFRTIFAVLRHRRLVVSQLFCNSVMAFTSFLWLEFSQSYQVIAILSTTSVYSVVYGYRFWTGFGLPGSVFPSFVVKCQLVLVCCNLVSHAGVLMMHFVKGGGCHGIGAWGLNSVLNGVILLLFLNFYVRMHSPIRHRHRVEN